MGWLWASSSKGEQAPAQKPEQPPSQQPAYDDPEVAKFLAFFQEETKPTSSAPPPAPESKPTPLAEESKPFFTFSFPSKPKSVSTPEPSSTSSLPNSPSLQADSITNKKTPPHASISPLDPLEDPTAPSPSEATLPTTMSCRAAFDYAFHCQSLGGQWNGIYRHGTLQDCSEKWGDFLFCMRHRTNTGPEKEEVIRDYYRKKELQKYYEGENQRSSEDIWQPRQHLVKEGTFMSMEMPVATDGDAQWNREEIARRKAARERLGYGPERGTHTVRKDT